MTDTQNPTAKITRWVDTPHGRIFVAEMPGEGTPIVLMHGFPDDHRIYNRLLPHLVPKRAVAFDFIGYGHSDRTEQAAYTYAEHATQITAVLDQLEIDSAMLVGHDASGPDAVRYTLDHPDRVSRLVLLNTIFGHRPSLRMPELTRLFSEPDLASLVDDLLAEPEKLLWFIQRWGVQWELDRTDPTGIAMSAIAPQFFGGANHPDARTAIRGWTATLLPALDEQEEIVNSGALAEVKTPVSIIFGARDPYLSPALANEIAALFHEPSLEIIADATHYVQHDQPETVAQIIMRPL